MNSDMIQAIVKAYTADNNATVASVAAAYNVKRGDVAAALRFSGLAVKRGARSGSTQVANMHAARAAAAEERKQNPLHHALVRLVEKYGYENVRAAFGGISTP